MRTSFLIAAMVTLLTLSGCGLPRDIVGPTDPSLPPSVDETLLAPASFWARTGQATSSP